LKAGKKRGQSQLTSSSAFGEEGRAGLFSTPTLARIRFYFLGVINAFPPVSPCCFYVSGFVVVFMSFYLTSIVVFFCLVFRLLYLNLC
jgi:hypothetical protein